MKLVTNCFFDNNLATNKYHCAGCAFTALYFQDHTKKHNERLINGKFDVEDLVIKWTHNKYNSDFVYGFIAGFDGDDLDWSWTSPTKHQRLGFKEGSRIRKYLILNESIDVV